MLMVVPIDTKKPSGGNIMQKLPRLSAFVWVLIIVVLVLVVIIPMLTSYFDQMSQQNILRDNLSKLQSQYIDLQKQISSQGNAATEINRLKSDVESARLLYGNSCDSIVISKELMDLAWKYDITITTISASGTSAKIQGKDYSGTAYDLVMGGQVANFQNYLIAVGEKFPTSKIQNVNILPAADQGTLDSANMTIVILCNQ
jgi:uncharacterized membrane-anchored protein YhcB (DUF1043 family)